MEVLPSATLNFCELTGSSPCSWALHWHPYDVTRGRELPLAVPTGAFPMEGRLVPVCPDDLNLGAAFRQLFLAFELILDSTKASGLTRCQGKDALIHFLFYLQHVYLQRAKYLLLEASLKYRGKNMRGMYEGKCGINCVPGTNSAKKALAPSSLRQ